MNYKDIPTKMKVEDLDRTKLLLDPNSNTKVYTPIKVVEDMLDILPKEIWTNPNIRFLDPCCKSGIFLERIFWRLNTGLQESIPKYWERSNHILKNQLFGLAIDKESAEVSREVLYGCKAANHKNAFITLFNDTEGNIKILRGTAGEYAGVVRTDGAFKNTIEEAFGKMRFNVIVGNPPYQENNGGGIGSGANSLYEKFIEQAIQIKPDYICMITKSSWFNGSGYKDFRQAFIIGRHIKEIVDFPNAAEIFKGMDGIAGGVSYFLWDRSYTGGCKFTNVIGCKSNIQENRDLKEFPIIVRYNEMASIINKVINKKEQTMTTMVSGQTPFGFNTNALDIASVIETPVYSIRLIGSHGRDGYVAKSDITKNIDWLDRHKVLIGQAMSGGCKLDSTGMTKVISAPFIIKAKEVCTQTYLVAGITEDENTAKNICSYLSTKFLRLLMFATLTSKSISPATFQLVPTQDFSKSWVDTELYAKYNLTQEEINFIESTIKPIK